MEGAEVLPRLEVRREKRTLNLRKGTYRVWVRPGYGFAEAYSPNEVTLKR